MVDIKTSHKILIIIMMLFSLSALSKIDFFKNRRNTVKQVRNKSTPVSVAASPTRMYSQQDMHEALMKSALKAEVRPVVSRPVAVCRDVPCAVTYKPTSVVFSAPAVPVAPVVRNTISFDDDVMSVSMASTSGTIEVSDSAYYRSLGR